MCKEIGLYAQTLLTILLGLIANIKIWDLYDHLMSSRSFSLIMNELFQIIPENYEGNGSGYDLDVAIISRYLRDTYCKESECRAKNVHLTPAYVKENLLPDYTWESRIY